MSTVDDESKALTWEQVQLLFGLREEGEGSTSSAAIDVQ